MEAHEWIRAHRKAAGLTQVQLAAKMQVQQSTIVRLESGRHVPLLTSLERVARELRVRMEITISREGVASFGPTPPAPKAKRKAKRKAKAEQAAAPPVEQPPVEQPGSPEQPTAVAASS